MAPNPDRQPAQDVTLNKNIPHLSPETEHLWGCFDRYPSDEDGRLHQQRLRRRAGERDRDIRCWWHLLVLVILLFGDESFVVIRRHRSRVVWLERAQRGGCGSAARRGIERSEPWRNEALGRGRAWFGSEADLSCESRRGREPACSRPCCSGTTGTFLPCPVCCPGRSLVGQQGKQVACHLAARTCSAGTESFRYPFSSYYLRERGDMAENCFPQPFLAVGGKWTVA